MVHDDKHASKHYSGGEDEINHNSLANLTSGDPHSQYILKADAGTWIKLGSGLTIIANNSEVTVLGDVSLPAGAVPVLRAIIEDTVDTSYRINNESTNLPPTASELRLNIWHKTTGKVDFRIRHAQGVAKNVRWQAYGVIA